MNTDLLNKALALCSEIEERQAQLREILKSLIDGEPAQSDKSECCGRPEPSEPSVPAVSDEIEHIEPVTAPAPDSEQEPLPAQDQEPLPEPAPEPLPEPAPLQVTQPAGVDLRKAFTINDRFRFRRELFGGDDTAMKAVIDRLSEARTYADAQAYIDTLAWDSDNEAAGEFKEIVSTFFNGYRI